LQVIFSNHVFLLDKECLGIHDYGIFDLWKLELNTENTDESVSSLHCFMPTHWECRNICWSHKNCNLLGN
jgi:hypothetical protein